MFFFNNFVREAYHLVDGAALVGLTFQLFGDVGSRRLALVAGRHFVTGRHEVARRQRAAIGRAELGRRVLQKQS